MTERRQIPAAILFDFNGVLVDDEPIHYQAFVEVLAPEGISLPLEDYQRYLGHDDRATFAGFLSERGRRVTDDQLRELVQRKQSAYLRLLGGGPRLFPGARELAEALHRLGIPLAIVSGARRVEIEPTLAACGLSALFSVVVAAEDVLSCKPDPEGYRLALRRLGAAERNGRCPGIALEDAPAGISAARAAGLRCIAVANSCPADRLQGADWVAASLAELDPAALAAGRI